MLGNLVFDGDTVQFAHLKSDISLLDEIGNITLGLMRKDQQNMTFIYLYLDNTAMLKRIGWSYFTV